MRFTTEVMEPAKTQHLVAIAAADAQLRDVLEEHTRREKELETVRQRVSGLRQELWQLDHSGGA